MIGEPVISRTLTRLAGGTIAVAAARARASKGSSTGALAAVMDGRYITEARTAAVSAVSVKHLARPDARVLAIIGTGVQARSHLEAIRHVRALTDVRVWSPNALHRDRFAAEMREATGLPVRSVAAAPAAMDGADLIVLATVSRTPVIADADVAPGTHIAAVGACRPDQREMPTPLVARARVFVDSRAAARLEAGERIDGRRLQNIRGLEVGHRQTLADLGQDRRPERCRRIER